MIYHANNKMKDYLLVLNVICLELLRMGFFLRLRTLSLYI
jgi:hypothetical protein